jgi:hypothetical protein
METRGWLRLPNNKYRVLIAACGFNGIEFVYLIDWRGHKRRYTTYTAWPYAPPEIVGAIREWEEGVPSFAGFVRLPRSVLRTRLCEVISKLDVQSR